MEQNLTKLTSSITERAINSGTSPETLAEKLDQLMPSVYIMIATLCALCVLLVILTKFLYNPVKKMIKNRQDFIQKNIDDSIQAKQNAFDYEQQARQKLEESKTIANEIISKSNIEAEMIKHQYIDQGKSEATRIIDDAKKEIKTRQETLEKEIHNEIVSVAIEISQKIIEDKISPKQAQKYLDEYLEKK